LRVRGDGAYAGVGSRQTPPEALARIEALAGCLAREGWILRTGLSPGADQAFYEGALAAGGSAELYLPWPGFEEQAQRRGDAESARVLCSPTGAARRLAARFHPGWRRLAADDRDLLARDAHELLGADLCSPSRFLVCWTADGSRDGRGLYEDGTGQALRIACHHAIPVFNLARPDALRELALDLGMRCPPT
jgi:hypothetical protein